MKSLRVLTVATAILLLFGIPAQAQTVEELKDDVQRSVCRNDWDTALVDLGRMIGNSDISTDYREALILYRRQIQTWRSTNTQIVVSEVTECEQYVAEDNDIAEPSLNESSRLNWDRAISAIQSERETSCDPSYPSMCIPVGASDLDCGGISQRNFTVFSPDPHFFDGDFDGIGCEPRR
ncbi:MAG: hypothetical protein AAGA75_28175 [Cyanobacteria bacterium P01_E01_bin.6]